MDMGQIPVSGAHYAWMPIGARLIYNSNTTMAGILPQLGAAARLFRRLLVRDEQRRRHAGQQRAAGAAQHPLAQARMAVDAHDDKIDIVVGGA
jgi:hypothetical protein